MPEMPTLIDRMLSTIRRFGMMERGDTVLVAVSGGPDSVALLHALRSLREDLRISLHVAHLNHSIRGEESDEDARYVRALADGVGIGSTVEKVDVPRMRRTLRLSEEEAARAARYDFLERTADTVGANRIALGHTTDDQVETVLLNLLRGTGVDGLSGMPPVRDRIIRPLIETRRAEVERYVQACDLRPRVDITNLIPAYTRNRVRLELLPLLRKDFNPSVDDAVLRLAELAREDSAYLNMEAEKALLEAQKGRTETEILLDPETIAASPTAIRRRVLRSAVQAVRGGIADIGLAHIDALADLLSSRTSFRYEFPGGGFAERSGPDFVVRGAPPEEVEYCRALSVPGSTRAPEAEIIVEAEEVLGPVEPARPAESPEVVLDYDKVVGTLVVRSRRPGDRIRPLGLGGTKKVQDVFVDGKIPRRMRHRVPIVADDEKIVWIVGLTLSEDVRITESTTKYLILRVLPAVAAVASAGSV